jgi:hypothetical protein
MEADRACRSRIVGTSTCVGRPYRLRIHYGPTAAHGWAGKAQAISYKDRKRRDAMAKALARAEHVQHVEVWDDGDPMGAVIQPFRSPRLNGRDAADRSKR